MGKPTICIGENKDADQADQRLCFRYSDSTMPPLTPFIQIQQTRKGLPNADINNCIAGIHKVRKHKQTTFK